ncbi:MAG: acetyltransferase [Patescibacteria group bacterium]|jgi:hypothetical protein
MIPQIVSLEEFIEDFGVQDFNNLAAVFSCPKDIELEAFLKDKAIINNSLSMSRTYLVVGKDETNNVPIIMAYFALALKSIDINAGISKTQRQKFTGTRNNNMKHIPVYLIGQFAKNFAIPENDRITGNDLMTLTKATINNAHKRVGGRIVLVECSDVPQLHTFYNTHGFAFYDIDSEDRLHRFVMKL